MRKTMLMVLTLAAGAASLAPMPVTAQACTDGYLKCLNDTHETKKFVRMMADIECFADYLKCIRG